MASPDADGIFNRLMSLPTLCYEIPDPRGQIYVHLGGGRAPRRRYSRSYEAVFLRRSLERIFSDPGFDPSSPIAAGAIVRRINELKKLTSARCDGLYTPDEQRGFVLSLSREQLKSLFWQIEFYEVCLDYAAAENAKHARRKDLKSPKD